MGSSTEQRLYIPFGTKRACCTEKSCSWAEETSIWLRNNTITQSNFWPLHWPSTLILLHFNIFFWKRDPVSEEKNITKSTSDTMTKANSLQIFSRCRTCYHPMQTWAATKSFLRLIRNQGNFPLPPTKKLPKHLDYFFITGIINKKIKAIINCPAVMA